MKTKLHLYKLKKIYFSSEPSEATVNKSWKKLEARLGVQDEVVRSAPFYRSRLFAVAALCLVLLFGVVGLSQKAVPGDVLYPVKRFSEEVALKIYPNQEIVTERRADEVIELIQKQENTQTIKKAAEEYEKSVDTEKENIEKDSSKEEEFKKRLEDNKKNVNEVLGTSTSFKEDNEDAKKAIEKAFEDGYLNSRHEKEREKDQEQDSENSSTQTGGSDKWKNESNHED